MGVDVGQGLLDRARRGVVLVGALVVGGGQGAGVEFPLGVNGSASSISTAAGTM
ncbi:hypothetical protein O982_25550 [Mycobacterium avium 10-5581]|nr:hypothetical protein O982_25550 [Mycobacterium avium 10-5581]